MATIKDASLDGSELNMIFQFDHTTTEYDPKIGRYGLNKVKLKRCERGWRAALFFCYNEKIMVSMAGIMRKGEKLCS